MLPASRRVLVFCPHHGCLQQFAIWLNRLEVYHLSLCTSIEEVEATLANGQRYSLFIYDDFSREDLDHLQRLAHEASIEQFLLIGGFNEQERLDLLRWAWSRRVPLLPVLARPFGLAHLRQALAALVDYSVVEPRTKPRLQAAPDAFNASLSDVARSLGRRAGC